MPRRASLDAVIEEALNELEGEFEASGGPSTTKNYYRWRVLLRRDFGGPEEPVESLSVSKSELRTPEDARVRHSAVVQMAYKKLKEKGTRGDFTVYRYRNGFREACSHVDLSQPPYLEIRDCLGFLPE
jgi:hypothetical protein